MQVPFLASIVLAGIGILLRNGLEDHYKIEQSDKIPLVEIFKSHRFEVWHFFIIASAIWMFYYTLFIYLPTWLSDYTHVQKATASMLNTYSIALGVISIPMMAYIADKFGSFKVMKISAIATLVLIVPIFLMLQNEDIVIQIVAVTLMTILLCAFQAPIFASAVNALPERRYRASFTAIILGSAAGVVGGTTPALMASVAKLSGVAIAPAFFILFATILSLRSMHYLMKRKS